MTIDAGHCIYSSNQRSSNQRCHFYTHLNTAKMHIFVAWKPVFIVLSLTLWSMELIRHRATCRSSVDRSSSSVNFYFFKLNSLPQFCNPSFWYLACMCTTIVSKNCGIRIFVLYIYSSKLHFKRFLAISSKCFYWVTMKLSSLAYSRYFQVYIKYATQSHIFRPFWHRMGTKLGQNSGFRLLFYQKVYTGFTWNLFLSSLEQLPNVCRI